MCVCLQIFSFSNKYIISQTYYSTLALTFSENVQILLQLLQSLFHCILSLAISRQNIIKHEVPLALYMQSSLIQGNINFHNFAKGCRCDTYSHNYKRSKIHKTINIQYITLILLWTLVSAALSDDISSLFQTVQISNLDFFNIKQFSASRISLLLSKALLVAGGHVSLLWILQVSSRNAFSVFLLNDQLNIYLIAKLTHMLLCIACMLISFSKLCLDRWSVHLVECQSNECIKL